MSTPRGSSDRIISLASWATTPTPPGPKPAARASRTAGSPSKHAAGRRHRGRCGRWPAAASPGPASHERVRLTIGDRPGSPDHRARTATLPVDAAAEAKIRSSASRAPDVVVGTSTSGSASHSGVPTASPPAGPMPGPPAAPPEEAPAEPAPAGRPPPPTPDPLGGPKAPSPIREENLGHTVRSSNSSNVPLASSASQPPRVNWSTWTSRGTSRTSGITSALIRTWSAWAARLARSFGDSASRWAKRVSRSPYSLTSLAAVFSPTPGTPGRLSEGSPRSAASSGYFSGRTPVRSSMPASS